jgi:hypothetical protein
MGGHWCPGGCSTLIPDGVAVCVVCVKYADENPDILAAIREQSRPVIADLEQSLANHAEFDRLYPDPDKEDK